MRFRLFASLLSRLRYRRVGGLRFARIGRLQISWCIVGVRAQDA